MQIIGKTVNIACILLKGCNLIRIGVLCMIYILVHSLLTFGKSSFLKKGRKMYSSVIYDKSKLFCYRGQVKTD